MAEDLINSIVDRPVVGKQITETTAELAALQKQLVDTANSAIVLNNALGRSNTNKSFTAAAAETEKAIGKIRTAEQLLAQQRERDAAKQEAIAAKRRKTIISDSAAEVAAYERSRQGAANMTTAVNQQQIAQGLAASRSAAYRQALTSTGTAATTVAAQVNTATVAVEANTVAANTSLRSIGAGLTKGLGYLRTLAYIIPGLGIAGIFTLAGTGILKAAEALGIFSSKATAVQTDLEKLLKSTSETAVTDAAKLDVLYEASQNLNLSLGERRAVVDKLQKDYPAYFGSLSQEAILAGEAASAYDNLSQSILNRAVISAAQKNIEELSKPLVELIVQEKNAKAAYEKANADFFKKTGRALPFTQTFGIIDETDKNLKSSKALGGTLAPQIQTIKEYKDALTAKINEAKAGLQVALQDFGINALIDPDREFKKDKPKKVADKSKQILDEQLKAIKQAEELILQSETATLDERLDAVDKFEVDSINLIQKAEDKKTVTVLQANNLRNGIGLEYSKDRLKIEQDAQKAIADAFQEGAKLITEQEREEITDFKEAQDERLLLIEEYKSQALLALADQYSQGKISVADYNQQVYDIENQSAKDRIDVQIETLKRIIELQKYYLQFGIGTQRDLQRSEAELTKFQISAAELVIKTKLDGIRAEKEARKDLANLERDIAGASIDLVKTLVEGGFSRRLEALNVEKEKINENADEEKKSVDRSLLTEQEKVDKTRLIDAKTEQSQKRLADQEKKIKHDQAVFEKVLSTARILQATAIAEVQALTYLSNPFTAPFYPAIAATIATLGAIQLATVLATPIPAYKEGTGYHRGGLARYGEAGQELILEPNKPAYLTQGDTIGDLPTGTKVISNKRLMNALANPGSNSFVTNQLDLSGLLQQGDRNTSKLISALNTKQKDTYRIGLRDGAKRSEYLRKNL